MKATQTGPGGPKKNGGYSQIHQQYANVQKNGESSAQTSGALANYTLPGVISYLTSEFTNLERFRIVTNLEKSEMKYRIQQLTSELNSVRFINEKQALRIKALESQLEQTNPAKHAENTEGRDKSGLESSSASEISSKNEQSSSLEKKPSESKTNEPEESSQDFASMMKKKLDLSLKEEMTEIPHIDLEFLRDSRQNLNRSIREIVSLLEPPSGLEILEAHSGPATHSNFEELLDNSKSPVVVPEPENHQKPKEDVFARYTLGKDDLLTGQRITFDSEAKKTPITMENDQREPDRETWTNDGADHISTDESDTDTVTIEEPDLIGILSNGIEREFSE